MATEQADLATSAFPIDWEDPADIELTWEHDSMHMPFALAPLSIDYVSLIMEGIAYSHGWFDAPFRLPVRFWNGYAFMAVRYVVPEPHKPAFEEYAEKHRAFVAESEAYWAGTGIPEIQASRDWFRSLDVGSMPQEDLAAAWSEAWRRSARSWEIHFIAIRGAYQITNDLSEFYESVVADGAPGAALRLVQGRAEVLHDVEVGLDRMTAMVRTDPALHASFAGSAAPTLATLESMPEATAFLAQLREYLDAHGHLGGSFDDIAFPSWVEEPSIVLGDIARRLTVTDGPTATQRRAALLAQADDEAEGVRAALASEPEKLDRFDQLLDAARRVGPLTEIHNYWIDRLVQSQIRSFAIRVGARLVEAGVIQAADDVLYFRRDEVPVLLLDPVDRHALVAERRAEHGRQKAMRPPAKVGKPPKPSAETDRFDGARLEAAVDGTLRGTGASAGVVRGTARIVLGPQDFGKVTPGVVIVAPSSNPSWVPLFSVAGGLLTNTGGVLSHAAVVAREFGLPAVVGLGDVTTQIPDGAQVELDGTTGFVRIL